MRARRGIILILAIFISTLAFGEIKKHSEELKIEKLNNGMMFYFLKNKEPENRAMVNIAVRAGSLQETEEQKGVAHFLEHMAFNGTKSYSKNGIIKYFQSIGLRFGGDLNAHTGFYETVYKLNLPTDDKKQFETGVEILKEMVFDATLTKNDVEGEKGIVTEEWRRSQGLPQRIEELWKKIIYNDSKYKTRFPIGDMKVIKNLVPETPKAYYEKWYAPENMAVIIVGDIDETYAREIVKKYLDSESKREYTKPMEYSLSELKTNYNIFKDKEITSTEIFINMREDRDIGSYEENIKRNIELLLLKALIENRFQVSISEKKLQAGSFFVSNYIRDKIIGISGTLQENKVKEGIEASINNLQYLSQYRVSEEALELEKLNLIIGLENINNNKESIKNTELITDITEAYVENRDFFLIEDTIKIIKEYFEYINPTDIQDLAKELYNDNTSYTLIQPEKLEIFKNEKEFEEYIKKIREEKLQKEEEVDRNIILKSPKLNVGSFASIKNMGEYKEISLSNGLKFLYKETDFVKDEIYIEIFKKEGSSVNGQKDYIASKFATDIIIESGVENITSKNQNIYMKGKKFDIKPYIKTYEQGIKIVSNKKSLEEAMKYFSYLVRKPKISEEVLERYVIELETTIKNNKNSIDAQYEEEIIETLYMKHPRKRPLKEKDVKNLTKERLLEVYKDKFENFNGYTGIIVGSINEEETLNLLLKYFASLEMKSNSEETWKDLQIKYPKDRVEKNISLGKDQKIEVNLFYPLYGEYSEKNHILGTSAAKILSIKLLEEVREKVSGVYSIGAYDVIGEYEQGFLIIPFSTDPLRKEEVLGKTKEVIKTFIQGEIDKEALESIRKNYQLEYETKIKTNLYWIDYLKKVEKNPEYQGINPKEYNEVVTEENLKKYLKESFKDENYIQVILQPKNVK